jgi:NADH:ubiquinone oxidoreductase subunit 5 (subunit L)/multisubunit Na+/H+ antiporter MnhA subunit
MPIFSGFASKWAIISSDLLAGRRILVLVLFGIVALFTSAITLASYVKFFGMTFASSGVEWNVRRPITEVPATMLIPKVLLAALCLVQGLFPAFFFGAFIGIFKRADGSILQPVFSGAALDGLVRNPVLGVSVASPGTGGPASAAVVPVVVLAVLAAGFLFAGLLKRSGGSEGKEVPTWLCGYQELNDRNRYTAGHLYAAFKRALRWTGGNIKKDKAH